MSDQPKQSFGEQLIRSQSISPSAEEKYHNEMQALVERRFSIPQRWYFLGVAVMCLAFALSPLFIRHKWATFPPQLQPWLLLVTPLAFLLMGAGCLWIAVLGRYNRKGYSYCGMLLAMLICGYGGIAMIEQGWAFDDPIARRRLIFSGVTMLLILGGTILLVFIEDLHRQTEERLIRLEYRLAQLSEKLDHQRETPGN